MEYANGILYHYGSRPDATKFRAELHCHSRFEILYITGGELEHVVEDRKYRVKAGDLILVRPSMYHHLEQLSEKSYERYDILFDPDRIGVDVSKLSEEMEVISLNNNPIADGLFRKLNYYFENLEEDAFTKLLAQMIYELFMNLQLFSDTMQREKIFLSPILTRALAYINENLFTVRDVDEISQALFISPSNLFYLFRTSLHQTPKKYITEKRLLAARRKIRAGNKPTEVYKECGFRDYTTFFRSYTARFGRAPSEDGK